MTQSKSKEKKKSLQGDFPWVNFKTLHPVYRQKKKNFKTLVNLRFQDCAEETTQSKLEKNTQTFERYRKNGLVNVCLKGTH